MGKKKKKKKSEPEVIRIIKFRNYVPLNEDLANTEIVKEQIGSAKEIEEQLIKECQENIFQSKNLVNITAQRPNWDLKRDIERKMQRLHRGTMRALRAVVEEKKRLEEAEESSSDSDSDSDSSATIDSDGSGSSSD